MNANTFEFKAFAKRMFKEHETRMWRGEKTAFLAQCVAGFRAMGYNEDEITLREDKLIPGVCSRNLLVGKPDAELLITAHYDTPGRSGWGMALSPVVGSTLSHAAVFTLMFGVGALQRATKSRKLNTAMQLVNLAMLAGMFVKNPHNHNDNTSGVLGVMRLAELVVNQPQLREKCAFVLFDHEEVGLLGSYAFAKWRKKHCPGKTDNLVINLDCVGCGDELTVMTKKKQHEMGQAVAKQLSATKIRGSNSDHRPFKNGVSLLYQKRSLLGPLYIPHLHSKRDRVCDLEQLERLCESVRSYIEGQA